MNDMIQAQMAENEKLVEDMKDNPWYPIIKQTNDLLTDLVPGYEITQIKDKFGGLRYYYNVPKEVLEQAVRLNQPGLDTAGKVINRAIAFVAYAVAWVDGFEAGKKNVGNPNNQGE